MGENKKPQYEGIDKYPGWIATLITLIVGGVFIGALYGNSGHHGDEHHGDEHGENHEQPVEDASAAPEAKPH